MLHEVAAANAVADNWNGGLRASEQVMERGRRTVA